MFIINDRLNLWKIHFAQMIDNKKKYISRRIYECLKSKALTKLMMDHIQIG